MNYLENLNPEQKKPVLDTEGAVLVFAGAGSGKTRVLTARIAYLLEGKNVDPYNILAITFTNKAAREMKERLEKITPLANDCWVSTIHGMCVKILRSSIGLVEGYNSNFTIYSETDKDRVLKRIIQSLNIESENILKNAKYHISNAKNKFLTPDQYMLEYSSYDAIDKYVNIFKEYNKELKKCNALDFDDLLVMTLNILIQHKEVADKYSQRFKYILVDEFQDTNKIQYDIIKILASYHKNIFCVGDDDQSIYGWRGAEIKNILDFSKSFKDSKVYKLEQNYRSTKRILDLANTIIKNNKERSTKSLWTDNDLGERVETFVANDELAEAQYTAIQIKRLIADGASCSDFAVLMRLNALSRAYEQEFTKYGIPYKVYGGFRFFERKEIKDITAYLRILSNPLDDEALLRVINVPKRGIGDKTISVLTEYSKSNGLALIDGIFDAEKLDLSSGAKSKLLAFKKLIITLMRDMSVDNLVDLFDNVVNKTDFNSQFDESTDEGKEKLMNVSELKSSVVEFAKMNPQSGLSEYLNSITLSTDTDDINDGNFVTVATIHSVKGLEFNTVFICGLDDNIFPISRAVGEPNEMEEERRLMYVAITRAKKRLYITRANSRFLFGGRTYTAPSKFLNELSEKLGLKPKVKERVENDYSYSQGSYSSYKNYNDNDVEPSKSYGVTSNFARSYMRNLGGVKSQNSGATVKVTSNIGYKPGKKVNHKKFGVGTIITVKQSGKNTVCDVAFKGVGVKSLVVEFAPMELID